MALDSFLPNKIQCFVEYDLYITKNTIFPYFKVMDTNSTMLVCLLLILKLPKQKLYII